MVVAFATAEDLGAQLNRTFTAEESAWIGGLLETAATYLRSVIGWDVFPQVTSTVRTWPAADGEVPLPQWPVASVGAVTRDGLPVEFTFQRGVLRVEGCDDVDVTFTHGAAVAPEDLKMWSCVLVGQMLFPLERDLGLTVGGLSSIQLDDFRVAFADGGADTGLSLSDRVQDRLRASYRGTVSTGDSR